MGPAIRRRRRRRGELVSKKLVLDNYTVGSNSPLNVVIGTIVNKINGSTVTLVDNDSDRFYISGNSIRYGPSTIAAESSSPRLLTLLETQSNGVKQYSQISINIESVTKMNFKNPVNSGLIVLL